MPKTKSKKVTAKAKASKSKVVKKVPAKRPSFFARLLAMPRKILVISALLVAAAAYGAWYYAPLLYAPISINEVVSVPTCGGKTESSCKQTAGCSWQKSSTIKDSVCKGCGRNPAKCKGASGSNPQTCAVGGGQWIGETSYDITTEKEVDTSKCVGTCDSACKDPSSAACANCARSNGLTKDPNPIVITDDKPAQKPSSPPTPSDPCQSACSGSGEVTAACTACRRSNSEPIIEEVKTTGVTTAYECATLGGKWSDNTDPKCTFDSTTMQPKTSTACCSKYEGLVNCPSTTYVYRRSVQGDKCPSYLTACPSNINSLSNRRPICIGNNRPDLRPNADYLEASAACERKYGQDPNVQYPIFADTSSGGVACGAGNRSIGQAQFGNCKWGCLYRDQATTCCENIPTTPEEQKVYNDGQHKGCQLENYSIVGYDSAGQIVANASGNDISGKISPSITCKTSGTKNCLNTGNYSDVVPSGTTRLEFKVPSNNYQDFKECSQVSVDNGRPTKTSGYCCR